MNGALLLIPTILVRYLLMVLISKKAMKRAAYFPPMIGLEKAAFWIYQASTVAFFIYLFFLRIKRSPSWLFYPGVALYTIGLLLLALSTINFASPSGNGVNRKGLYRFSRNPMYIAYFLCFLGCAALTQSLILFGITLLFQVTAHWIILSEERWCVQQLGAEYLEYMKKVRRYI